MFSWSVNPKNPTFKAQHPFGIHLGICSPWSTKQNSIGAPEINTNGRQNDHLPFQVPASWQWLPVDLGATHGGTFFSEMENLIVSDTAGLLVRPAAAFNTNFYEQLSNITSWPLPRCHSLKLA